MAVVLLGLHQGTQKLSQQQGTGEPRGSLGLGQSLCLPVPWPEQPNPEISSTGAQISFALTDGKSQISSSPEKPVLNVSLL